MAAGKSRCKVSVCIRKNIVYGITLCRSQKTYDESDGTRGGEGNSALLANRRDPKLIGPVADTPIIEYIFGLLERGGIAEYYINVYYRAGALLDAYGAEPHVAAWSCAL